jgi:hypothetical protein
VQNAAEIKKTALAFERFALSGYKKKLFTKEIYLSLSQSFGFIAHYDRDGFYAARFGTPVARMSTLATVSTPPAWCAENALEKALRVVAKKHDLFEAAVRERDEEVEQRELAELARLKAKYESKEKRT